MNRGAEIAGLLYREARLEWRQRAAFNGLLAYAASLVVLVGFAWSGALTPLGWAISFQLVLLFVAVNAVAKSFLGEAPEQHLYVYQLAHAEAVVLAKLVYNMGLLVLLAGLCGVGFFFFLGNPFEAVLTFWVGAGLEAAALAAGTTLVAAIAAQAGGKGGLMAVLSFPVVLPVLLVGLRVSRSALVGTVRVTDLLLLGGVGLVAAALSVVLFPYLWRD